ncbi:MAG: fluoride efflux transporter CrcB [Citromicrobium sp.]|jgi:fluoride exporter|uniref:Fluoride-specific ion channel FluC n=1 Tax=Qipengyuania pacifica TaxID=2860199 RepID=A0ABS7JIJ0_9SPHN|nr:MULTISPECIES: fluoride efflux transporter CrcB [Erythrobacteraceae]MAG41624.1 fluoride efflux transporter CrcB [Erythrobacteraceae bacterium]MBL4897067.1 fluoride efflux transporter CrcB [Erythrobacter sp.]MBV01346.1 fluoride efflux transporter CrcB [Citromicrobium sp.]MEC7889034.1 fluoride efflux transporter CrcB [Pseudomonadota bacterium]QPL39492.1 fluoride efflux transporter CrcB [Erythrobacter sp. A30-3]|tara:strand:- start:107 stop:517 length:411 start_codon:yes stop_codon:yes gene_type:complete
MSSFSPFVAALHVFLGGGVGAVLRWQLGRAMTSWLGAPIISVFPFATLAANAAGSLFMGLLAGWLARHGSGGSEQLRLLLGVGLLGGFTTFSAFSLEMVLLIERGQYLFALLYAFLSIALGITGLMVGLGVMRMAG